MVKKVRLPAVLKADDVIVSEVLNVFRFACGDRVKDRISGFKGVVINRTEWINGCRRYAVQGEGMHDGLPLDAISLDEEQLERAGKPLKLARPAGLPPGGGGRRDPQRPRDPTR